MANITQGTIDTRTGTHTQTAGLGYEILSQSSQSKVLRIDGKDDFELVPANLIENSSELVKKYAGCTVFVVVPKVVQKSKVFNFLGLSAELRNMVYHELLVFESPILVKGQTKKTVRVGKVGYFSWDTPPKPSLQILLTNKQINSEAT